MHISSWRNTQTPMQLQWPIDEAAALNTRRRCKMSTKLCIFYVQKHRVLPVTTKGADALCLPPAAPSSAGVSALVALLTAPFLMRNMAHSTSHAFDDGTVPPWACVHATCRTLGHILQQYSPPLLPQPAQSSALPSPAGTARLLLYCRSLSPLWFGVCMGWQYLQVRLFLGFN